MTHILFINFNATLINFLIKEFNDLPNIEFSLNNVRDVTFNKGTMFVSPANSFGFMDGGIDVAYSAMFPDVQRKVQDKIRILGKKTSLGRNYLPIGSAVIVPVGYDCMLVSAPTMFLPQDVSKTKNAYYAMMASLMAFKKQGSCNLLITTNLCCGYGKMNPSVSAKQMRKAYDDFHNGNIPIEIEYKNDPSFLITRDHDYEQPRNFDNREIHEK
jgi:O-acetyl-ADP-ribose deacetylase (regulator of RNase III)